MESLAGRHVFVVEDNLENRMITQMALFRTGMRITFDAFGRDTLRRMKKVMPVDLILMDLMLPLGISGYDIFEKIHADEELQHIPICALSAAEPAYAIPKCKQKGFAGFIAKPIDIDRFGEQIQRLLQGEQLWNE
jgi:two-component system, cell cycle response regulator DivK